MRLPILAQRWMWFFGLWVASFTTLAIVAMAIRSLIL